MSNCYKKPHLQKVIVKLDFTAKLQITNRGLPKEVSDTVLKIFPIPEPKQIISKRVQISPEGTVENNENQNHLYFHGKLREKTLCIAPNFLFIEITKYDTFQRLKDEFCLILDKLNDAEEFSVNRFGLRYINNIDLNEEDPLNWANYLNETMLHMFDVTGNRTYLSRVFSNIVQHFDDGMQLNYNYGMHNPDFPSRIKRKVFILDFDASYQGVLIKDEVKALVDTAHDRIENLFERCITDNLRTKMEMDNE
jgi:uncharacterized protein (TIGR04255 family)